MAACVLSTRINKPAWLPRWCSGYHAQLVCRETRVRILIEVLHEVFHSFQTVLVCGRKIQGVFKYEMHFN